MGIYAGYQGSSEEALLFIEQGLELVDEVLDPGWSTSPCTTRPGSSSTSASSANPDRPLEDQRAAASTPAAGSTSSRSAGSKGKSTPPWRGDRAESALVEVKEGFAAAGLDYKAALAGPRARRGADPPGALRGGAS